MNGSTTPSGWDVSVCATGGYAALTPGYSLITPTGFQSESLRDWIMKETQRRAGR